MHVIVSEDGFFMGVYASEAAAKEMKSLLLETYGFHPDVYTVMPVSVIDPQEWRAGNVSSLWGETL